MNEPLIPGLWADDKPIVVEPVTVTNTITVNVVNDETTEPSLSPATIEAIRQIAAFTMNKLKLRAFTETDTLVVFDEFFQEPPIPAESPKAIRDEHLKNSRHKNQKGPVKRGY